MKGVILKHIGKITKLSGNNGELVVFSKILSQLQPKVDDLLFVELQRQMVPFYIETVKKLGTDRFLIKFDNVNTTHKATLLLEAKVFSTSTKNIKTETPEVELNGYQLYDLKKEFIGVVDRVDFNPKNPILYGDSNGKEIIIPFNENIILEIDQKNKMIKTDIPDGLLELYLGDEG